MVMDPVCGMDVDETSSHRVSFHRRTYYFCSHECRVEFEESPNDFIDEETFEPTGI
jgi:P-type Cu+ transporter